MATLTDVAYKTRQIIKFGSIGIVVFFILKFALGLGLAYWRKLHPAPPAPPTVEFGKLPKIQFPPNQAPTFNYILELPTGDFPDFPDRAKVFIVVDKTASFMAWDKAKQEATKLGFTKEAEAIGSEVYRWSKNTPLTTILEMNIVDGSFEYSYSWQEDPAILEQKSLPAEQEAILETKSFLQKIRDLNEDLLNGEAEATYLRLEGTKLSTAPSYSEADFVKVDLFRADIEDMPVVTADAQEGIVSALISGSQSQQFLEISFNYFSVNYSVFATYPIKTPKEAWEALKANKGHISSWTPNITNVVVRRVYLGFVDILTPHPYLQPVFIFKGDNDFVGLVPAIADSWYQ